MGLLTHPFDTPDADWGDLDSSAEWDSFDFEEEDEYPHDAEETDDAATTPSLPIILFSAASGIAGGVLALFISLRWFELAIEFSAGVATLGVLFSLGISGAVLTAATGSRAAPVNILFSCGLIVLAGLFLALCLLVGALVATLIV